MDAVLISLTFRKSAVPVVQLILGHNCARPARMGQYGTPAVDPRLSMSLAGIYGPRTALLVRKLHILTSRAISECVACPVLRRPNKTENGRSCPRVRNLRADRTILTPGIFQNRYTGYRCHSVRKPSSAARWLKQQ
jgi:hypothetical protein